MTRKVLNKLILCSNVRERFTVTVRLFLTFLIFSGSVFAQAPNAGTVISSCSEATYRSGGNDLSVFSNTITFDVMAVYGPMLLPDGSVTAPAATAAAFSGQQVTFPYTLANNGNDDDSFTLSIIPVSPSDFIPVDLEVYLDQDGDGAIDPEKK